MDGLSPDKDTYVDAPVILTTYPHDCIGNINRCEDGLSVMLRYTPPVGDPRRKHLYVISNGGQSPMSEGFYIRQNSGREYETGVSKGDRIWTVKFFLVPESPAAIIFTWNEALHVYVDGMPAGTNVTGASRVFTDPEVDVLNSLVVGKANDDFSSLSWPSIRLIDVTIQARVVEDDVMQSYSG